ncbi:MAG: hypothetical protein E7168_01210 [Firmicutes bacterium]|nr:hypothetical protein [Bacillota bacterium]
MKKLLSKLSDMLADSLLGSMDKKLEQIKSEIQKDIKKVDEGCSKNFLVSFLKDVENGEKIDEVEYERFYEVYDHYTNDLHLNSYIHRKVEKLEKEGKL